MITPISVKFIFDYRREGLRKFNHYLNFEVRFSSSFRNQCDGLQIFYQFLAYILLIIYLIQAANASLNFCSSVFIVELEQEIYFCEFIGFSLQNEGLLVF